MEVYSIKCQNINYKTILNVIILLMAFFNSLSQSVISFKVVKKINSKYLQPMVYFTIPWKQWNIFMKNRFEKYVVFARKCHYRNNFSSTCTFSVFWYFFLHRLKKLKQISFKKDIYLFDLQRRITRTKL